jgi:hypothetical protein
MPDTHAADCAARVYYYVPDEQPWPEGTYMAAHREERRDESRCTCHVATIRQQEAELKRLRDTLHSIDAVLLKESPIERLHVSTSMERRILRMITVAFEVE